MPGHHHRATLKQQNKPFKSKHASKSSLKEKAKGRIPISSTLSSHATTSTKLDRRNHAKQIQSLKRQTLADATKIFSGPESTRAPRIVAVIPLSKDLQAKQIISAFANSINSQIRIDECPNEGVWKLNVEKFRSTIQFILLPYGEVYRTLDAIKAADFTVLGFSSNQEVDSKGDTLLRCLQAQGLPQTIAVMSSTETGPHHQTQNTLRSLLSFTQYFVPTVTRVYDLTSPSDTGIALRSMCEGKPADVKWRDGRGWLLAEDVTWEEGSNTLKITGVVRGTGVSADRLVHIPGWGDYGISSITTAPLSIHPTRPHEAGMELDASIQVISSPTEDADDLQSTVEVDDMAGEQTWPTEDEMQGLPHAAESEPSKSKVRRVPKGTSSYQAAWLLDEDGGSDIGSENNEGEKISTEQKIEEEEEEEEYEELVEEEVPSKEVRFEDMDMEEEERQLNTWRSSRNDPKTDSYATQMAFPDEIDTPLDVSARVRFARFRGLKSSRTSPWDPNENLPLDYAKIWRVGGNDWERMGKKSTDAVEAGTRVTLHVSNVPRDLFLSYARQNGSHPLVVFSLHKHEHKKSVVHFTIQRSTEYDGIIKSKDPLILCVGPRRFVVRPIYSQHKHTPNNVHKFERYLPAPGEGAISVGTIFAPLSVGRVPVTILLEPSGLPSSSTILVGTGTLLPPSTARVIAKRIVLTGHPIKIHKRTVTVRYMFFNPEDVAYFKPVALYTKYGREGHIAESLGTHGYFKARFSGPVTQMDTVCMALWKRVYPKWAEPVRWTALDDGGDEDQEMMES